MSSWPLSMCPPYLWLHLFPPSTSSFSIPIASAPMLSVLFSPSSWIYSFICNNGSKLLFINSNLDLESSAVHYSLSRFSFLTPALQIRRPLNKWFPPTNLLSEILFSYICFFHFQCVCVYVDFLRKWRPLK